MEHSEAVGAEKRRRSEVGYAVGVTFHEMKNHCKKTIPGLAKTTLSTRTIARLCLPPGRTSEVQVIIFL